MYLYLFVSIEKCAHNFLLANNKYLTWLSHFHLFNFLSYAPPYCHALVMSISHFLLWYSTTIPLAAAFSIFHFPFPFNFCHTSHSSLSFLNS